MSSFVYIISKLYPNINVNEVAYFSPNNEKKKIINMDFISYGFLNALKYKPSYLIKESKYKILYHSVINNTFVNEKTKEKVLYNFYKAQRIYFAFCRQAYLYKVKRTKIYDINTDLCMTPLSNFKKTMLLKIYDNITNKIYYYRTSDIINIICTALSNSPEFFVEPLLPKNPYSNIVFTNAQLYNIYFSIRDSKYIMPTLFHQFFLKNFNIIKFTHANECYIRDYAIDYFIKNSSLDQKYSYVKELLIDNKQILSSIAIHPLFSKDKLTITFQIYLKDYLIMNYSLNPWIRSSCKKKLKKDLIRFNKLNPTYGRKIYYKKHILIPKCSFSFRQNTIIRDSSGAFIFDNSCLEETLTHSFVDNVFLDSPKEKLNNEELHKMGLASNQTIIPSLSIPINEQSYSNIPINFRNSLNQVIGNLRQAPTSETEPTDAQTPPPPQTPPPDAQTPPPPPTDAQTTSVSHEAIINIANVVVSLNNNNPENNDDNQEDYLPLLSEIQSHLPSSNSADLSITNLLDNEENIRNYDEIPISSFREPSENSESDDNIEGDPTYDSDDL